MKPLFFIHIPKTAGTSFRKSAEECFGVNAVEYDYEPMSLETTDNIRRWVYEEKDFFELKNSFQSSPMKFLSGHVPASKYLHLFGIHRSITFLREPIQRTISEYQHFVRHYDFEGDLPSFYRKPHFINRQSKMLQGVPIRSLGVVGLNEAYENSLAMINSRYGLDIACTSMNMGRKRTDQGYELPDEQREEMLALNEDDVALYRRAQRLFDTRWALFQKDLPFVHGDVQQLSDKSISGWAWWGAERTDAVALTLRVNGEDVGNVQATQLRPGLLRLAPPRMGYIGFHHHFARTLKPSDQVEVVVTETGQVIGQQRLPETAR